MMQVPEFITPEMFEAARTRVEKKICVQALPTIKLISKEERACALKLHVGHYKDTNIAFEEISNVVNEQGYRISGKPREI
jgi:hypothetical protein